MARTPSQALILCGGLGSRLGSLTAGTPKPLLPVAGRPFLDVLLFELGRHGIGEIVLLAAFEAGKIADYAETNEVARRFGVTLSVAIEPDRAGTAGAVHHAKGLLRGDFLLLNGDSWLQFDLPALADAASRADCDAVLTLRRLPDASRSGVVTLDGDKVTSFQARPAGPGPGLVNAGMYWFSEKIAAALPASGSLEQEVLPALSAEGRVRGIVREGYFIDIGVPETYERAQTEIPERLPELY